MVRRAASDSSTAAIRAELAQLKEAILQSRLGLDQRKRADRLACEACRREGAAAASSPELEAKILYSVLEHAHFEQERLRIIQQVLQTYKGLELDGSTLKRREPTSRAAAT